MFAEWVGPILELSRQAEATRVLEEAKTSLEYWANDLAIFQHTPKTLI